jgi:lipopolysaccharide/colanic/teichoic acid biosynthesis glycosyltransferase
MILKRIVDVVLSGAGLLLATPLLAAITLILKLESRGPVLYRCKRVGRFGEIFEMFKFRTMVHNADSIDCRLCCNRDVRVTRFGKLLRRTKLNELPQLINVLIGNMSLVGPRPEDPKFVSHYADKWEIVFRVKPGIVGPNQVVYRNEEDLLEQSRDPERLYIEELLPKKLELDIEYARNRNLWGDISLLVQGVYITIFGSKRFLRIFRNRDLLTRVAEDSILAVLAYFLAYYCRFETINLHHIIPNMAILVAINPFVFGGVGLYRRAARFFSVSDLSLVVKAVVISVMLLLVGNWFFVSARGNSRAVALSYPLILICLMSGTRLLRRLILEKKEMGAGDNEEARNVLIYGAGRVGVETAKRLQFEPGLNVLGFVDDDPGVQDLTILGLKVLGTGSDLPFLKTLHNVERIFVAFKSPSTEQLNKVRRCCNEAGLTQVLIRSSVPGCTSAPFIVSESFRRIRISDQLEMTEVPLNTASLRPLLEDATVAVDGAGDQVGEQLCRELLRLKVGKLVLIDSCPQKLHKVANIVESTRHHSTRLHAHLVPDGYPDLYQHFLAQYDLAAVILNRPGRPANNLASNGTALFLLHFVETVRRADAVNRLGCRCLSFVSPFLKDSLSPQEKALHLLSEHYVRAVGEAFSSARMHSGVIRVANVLEADCDLFHNDFGTAVGDGASSAFRFISARYAARIVLNSLPLYQNGDTFVESASQPYLLRALIDQYLQILANSNNAINSDKDRNLIATRPSFRDEAILSCCEKTSVCDVLALTRPDLPDVTGLQLMAERNRRYLDQSAQFLIGEFISFLGKKFELLLHNGIQVRYRLDAA